MSKQKLRIWELGLFLATAIMLLMLAVGGNEQQHISEQVLRLHILANSDSAEDQALKLKVRDGILEQAEDLTAGITDRAEAEQILNDHLEELCAAGAAVVKTEGYDYSVRAQITDCYFPTREYTDFSLPAGWYRALRMEIGEGAGRNWWCVVYPPLCSTGVTEVQQVSFPLEVDEVGLITQQSTEYVLRFQCAEWWGELMGRISGQ
ncbi:MAG: stage II sporulation protein R [Oscillospiraceae bacterium]|nr:stage II sporulation protein R [Oscillospiraceae bacterium]